MLATHLFLRRGGLRLLNCRHRKSSFISDKIISRVVVAFNLMVPWANHPQTLDRSPSKGPPFWCAFTSMIEQSEAVTSVTFLAIKGISLFGLLLIGSFTLQKRNDTLEQKLRYSNALRPSRL